MDSLRLQANSRPEATSAALMAAARIVLSSVLFISHSTSFAFCGNGLKRKPAESLLHKIRIFGNDSLVTADQYTDAPTLVDPRIKFMKQLNAIGYIEVPADRGTAQATSFLVGECHVLANHHAVFEPGTQGSRAVKASFKIGKPVIDSGKDYAEEVEATPVAWGEFQTEKKADQDWVLLRLTTCLGKNYGFLNLHAETGARITLPNVNGATEEKRTKRAVAIIGFPGHKNIHHLWMQTCHIRDTSNRDHWKHDCPAWARSSGSPIVQIAEDGTLRVIAMHSSEIEGPAGVAPSYTPELSNFATPAYSMINEVRQAIEADMKLVSL